MLGRQLDRRAASTLALTAALLAASTVKAQTAGEEDEATPTLTADEILIRGGKIERTFLETPTSVGVVTSEQIEDFVILDTFDGFNMMANVRRLNTNGGNDSFQIRGLNADGIADIANSQPLVSLIIDGATQNSEGLRRGARSTWDLKQIEVLRGPQSGLYGRAALAGAVVLESNDPTYFFEGAGKLNFGTVNASGGAFMVSGPVVEDQVALRISGEIQTEDKDITVTDPLNAFFAEDEFHNFRAKLLIEPEAVPDLHALFTFNHAFDQTANPLVSQPFLDRVFDGSGLASEGRETTVNNYIANISYDLTDELTLRSLSSFIDTDLRIFGAPGSPVFARRDLRDGKDFTQEIVLEIEDQEGTGLSGVIGAFYGDFVQDIDTEIQVDSSFVFGGAPTGIFVPVQSGTSSSTTESFALYADLRYNFYGPFSLLGGLRYQHDTVRNTSNVLSVFGNSIFDVEAEFDVVLPKAGLAYEIDETQTLSAIASRGYRQGFTENIIGTTLQNDVDPEFVWTYELAYRYASEDGALSLGANAFYNDYADQQITIENPNFPPFTNTFNVGESRSYGLEIEGRYATDFGLSVFGSLGLLKTEITELVDAVCTPSGGSCNGNEFPEAPSVTLAFGGIYRHHSGVFGTADFNYTGSYFSNGDINNTAAREIDGYFLANASIGYETENFVGRLYVRNLLDEDYLTSIGASLNQAAIGDGRTIGAELSVKF